mgnify:CR=1 FL=1
MIQQRLYEWIKHPEQLNRETLYELRTLLAHYPYFQTARLLLLNNLYLLHEADFGVELRRSVLYIYDRRSLHRLIEGYSDKLTIEDNGFVNYIKFKMGYIILE